MATTNVYLLIFIKHCQSMIILIRPCWSLLIPHRSHRLHNAYRPQTYMARQPVDEIAWNDAGNAWKKLMNESCYGHASQPWRILMSTTDATVFKNHKYSARQKNKPWSTTSMWLHHDSGKQQIVNHSHYMDAHTMALAMARVNIQMALAMARAWLEQ